MSELTENELRAGINLQVKEIERLRARVAELEAQQRAGVPEGWKLVPVEPTKEMIAAGRQTIKGASDYSEGMQAEWAYSQMLAAAPAPKAQEQLSDAPCSKCGYNGRGYYQPETHQCAAPQPAEVGADERTGFENFMSQKGLAASYQGDGWYRESSTNLAWQAWQARAQLTEVAEATGDLHEYFAGMRAALRSGDWRKASTRAELESFLGRMEAALTAAGGREEPEELRRDAERYRWLREQCKQHNGLTIAEVGSWDLTPWSGDDPDARIDEAIAATQPAKEGE